VLNRLLAASALFALSGPVLAQIQTEVLPEVTVQSGRLEQKQFDAPASVYAIDADTLRSSGPQVNLSDALNRVPGVVALNRNNYAQDVQISIRGFGARAAFGLRGIRLITDGIPASIPDGQGQASTASLTSTERIEVLTGPLAQLYGNASGGVIQTFTREAGTGPELQNQLFIGSFGMTRTDWQMSDRLGQVGIVADYSTFGVDGYRANSDARRQQLNSVITVDAQPDTRLKLIVNVFDMPYAKDPIGLTAAQLSTPQIAGTNAVSNGARKTVKQEQLGGVLEHRIDSDLALQARVYSGMRDNLQYQASSTTPNAGTWVGLSRHFDGVGLQLKGKGRVHGDTRIDWVVGLDKDHAGEQRQGGNTAYATQTGLATRNEMNEADNQDYFGQVNWHLGERWTVVTGLRRSSVALKSRDDYLSDGKDGSGLARYTATNPILGLTWHASDTLNLYINQGKGFETPTLSEAAYTQSGSTVVGLFNPNLLAARSQHLEVGSKWAPSAGTRLDAAWFRITTDNEIVSSLSAGGKTAYTNASQTQRDGLELSWRQQFTPHWRSLASATLMNANYTQSFNSVLAGNKLPGTPQRQLFSSLQWSQLGFSGTTRKPALGTEVALDWMARSALWADDNNTASAAGYGMFNARVRQRYQVGRAQVEAFVGIDNLTQRSTVGSVIVNQASSQFFEPGLPRSWVLGVQSRVPL